MLLEVRRRSLERPTNAPSKSPSTPESHALTCGLLQAVGGEQHLVGPRELGQGLASKLGLAQRPRRHLRRHRPAQPFRRPERRRVCLGHRQPQRLVGTVNVHDRECMPRPTSELDALNRYLRSFDRKCPLLAELCH